MSFEREQLISQSPIFEETNGTQGLTRVLRQSRSQRRIILKNGKTNISGTKTTNGFSHFTKLLESSWTYMILVFLTIMWISWIFFAVIWWLICYTHGDFLPNHLPPLQKENNWTPCVYQMHNFISCLLYSIETQHTVAYGVRATTTECPEAIFVNTLQCITGFIMQATMSAIIFSKITLPKLRSQTIIFSKNATIAFWKGQLRLMFRIGDYRRNHLTDIHVKGFYIRTERTVEGEILDQNQTELELKSEDSKKIFFHFPTVIYHTIDSASPLFDLSHSDGFEIVVVLEGVAPMTDQMVQARTSYLPNEIFWGKQFEDLITYDFDRRSFIADYSKFDSLIDLQSSFCSDSVSITDS